MGKLRLRIEEKKKRFSEETKASTGSLNEEQELIDRVCTDYFIYIEYPKVPVEEKYFDKIISFNKTAYRKIFDKEGKQYSEPKEIEPKAALKDISECEYAAKNEMLRIITEVKKRNFKKDDLLPRLLL